MKRRSELLAEGVVIVVSVLLALSADAWWATQQDASRAREHLLALSRDFEQMSTRIDSSLSVTEAALNGASSLVPQLLSEAPELAADSARARLFPLLTFEVFSPSTGAYSALVGSGELGLIESVALKRALSDFFGGFEDVRVSERVMVEQQHWFIQTEAFARLMGVHRLGFGDFSLTEQLMVLWSESDVIMNGLASLYYSQAAVQEDYRWLRKSITEIQELLAIEAPS